MKFKKSNSADELEVDMTPMIDIVFQLIAFFMVITNFEQTQADERVKLPRDTLATPPEVKREDTVTLNVGFKRDDNGALLDEEPYVFFGDDDTRVRDCTKNLQQEQEFFKAISTPLEEVTVEIRADADVPTGLVQELIRMCQEVQFQRFALKATQESI